MGTNATSSDQIDKAVRGYHKIRDAVINDATRPFNNDPKKHKKNIALVKKI